MLILIYNSMDNKKWLIIIGLLLLLAGAVIFIFSFNKKQLLNKTPSIFEPSSDQKPVIQTPSFQPINLIHWKLTLPINSLENSSKPLEIKQPQLATYQINPWFEMTPDKKGIIFRAPVNAPTTANSNYPRSELREMTDNGTQEFFWSSIKGTHTLFLEESITATPKNKPDVVAGQIHGDDSDLLVVRLEGQKLYLTRGGENLTILDNNYVLGRRFTVKFEVSEGKIATYYNNNSEPVHILEKKVNQAYFKVGVYTQSNCETEELAELCSTDNYGEVIIYQAQITHK